MVPDLCLICHEPALEKGPPIVRNQVPYTGTVPVRLGLHIGHNFLKRSREKARHALNTE